MTQPYINKVEKIISIDCNNKPIFNLYNLDIGYCLTMEAVITLENWEGISEAIFKAIKQLEDNK